MTFDQIESQIKKTIEDDPKVADARNRDFNLIIREHLHRIQADPESSVSIINLLDTSNNSEFRKYLFNAYGAAAQEIPGPVLAQVISATKQVILNRQELEPVRIAALMFSDEFFQAGLDKELLSASQFSHIGELYMGLVLDPTETTGIRIAGLRAVRSLGLNSGAKKLLDLIVSGDQLDISLSCQIISLLGEWQYQDFRPVAISILEDTESQKLRDTSARALSLLSGSEIVSPLVKKIKNNQDGNFACRYAINSNAHLVYDVLQSGNNDLVILGLQASHYIRGNPIPLVSQLEHLLDNNNNAIAVLAVKRMTRDRDPQILTSLFHRRDRTRNLKVKRFLNDLEEQMAGEIQLAQKQSKEETGTKGIKPHLEIGSAVYRDKGYPNYNHVALYIGWRDEDYGALDEIIHANDGQIRTSDFCDIWDDNENPFRGVFECSGMSFEDRIEVIETAKELIGIPYVGYFSLDALDYNENLDYSTQIEIGDIEALRCDGTVEYCYEYNGFDVWDQATTAGNHYDISYNRDWADEHNDSPELNVDCEKEFSPLAQRGADSCNASNTNFEEASEAGPPEMTLFDPRTGVVTITATDTYSGIYNIMYRFGGEENPWVSSPIQENYPSGNTQSISVSTASDTLLTIRIWDNAGNLFEAEPYNIVIDQLGACPVDKFLVQNGKASWAVLDEEGSPRGYSVLSSINGYSDRWVEIGSIAFSGIGNYEASVDSDDEDMIFRLMEENSTGEKEIAATYIPRDNPFPGSSPVFKNELQIREIIESQLVSLKNGEKNAEGNDDATSETRCVIYCAPQLFSDAQSYLISFWENYMGVDVELIDVSIFPSQPDDFRVALKSSICDKAAEGIELFHLIGDASEWDEVAGMDPAEFPFNGTTQPERDQIPTFYLYDSESLAWGRPYYSSDFPYSDIDEDGIPDVAVTRWPVSTTEELLPRISKVIAYNQHRASVSNFSGMQFWGLIQDISTNGNSGPYAEEIALNAIGSIPEQANVSVSVLHNSELEPGNNVPQILNRWNSLQPECIFIWSPHSKRRQPNNMLDNATSDLGPGYSSLVVAANCLTADFSRTDIEDSYYDLAADTYCRHIEKGSIAWIGPTSVSFQRANKAFTETFARVLFSHPEWTMAKSWLETMREVISTSGSDQTLAKNIRTFAFLGDPLSRLEQQFHVSFVSDQPDRKPDEFYASPNPFNPTTSVVFYSEDRAWHTVEVFDLRGHKVKTLFSDNVEPNSEVKLVWNGDNENGGRVSSGTYFIRLKSKTGRNRVLKVSVVK